MRHGKRFNHLSRTSAHRKAMLANMASSLIKHKRIKTTVAKAKALRTYIEPLITKSKIDSTHSRRVVFSYLNDKDAVTELFREVSVKVADRPGGYTRIIKIGPRLGDNAEMALIELVDFNENLLQEKTKGPKKTRRRRGGAAKAESEAKAAVAESTVEAAVEEIDEVEAKEETPVEKPEAAEQEKAEESTQDTQEQAEEEKKEVEAEEQKKEVKAEAEKKEVEAEAEKKEVEAEVKVEKEDDAEDKPEASSQEPDATDEKPEAESEDKKKEE